MMNMIVVGVAVLGFLLAVPAVSAQAVWHYCSLNSEDGDPKFDSDGTKDGTLTFGAGTHVINKCNLFGTDKLVIEPGAVVKIAASCTFDQDYQVTQCKPHTYCCSQELWAYGTETSIRIDGATITDVRDNTVGTAISIDGTSTTPVPSYSILFNADGDNRISNSTIKYCGEMSKVGNMEITGNQFLFFGGISESFAQVLINTSPVITDNLFELAYPSNGAARIDLRGKSPLFSGNTVRGVLVESPSYPAGSNIFATGVLIGPSGANMGYPDATPWGPATGRTIISGNTFETATGVAMERGTTVLETQYGYERVTFRGTIANNTFRGTNNPEKDTPGSIALELVMDAEVTVTGNEVSNYATPFTANSSPGIKQNRLMVNANRFSLEGSNANAAVYGGRYTQGFFVNAENNFWGDPSGPLDRSKADGMQNIRGKGIVVGDGVDYVPFVGGAPLEVNDIHIVSGATRIFENDDGDEERASVQELAVGDSVEFEVIADLIRFRTADTGRIVVHLIDADGNVLFTSQPVSITADDTAAEIPPFALFIPASGAYLELQAELIPAGEEEGEGSNVDRYHVKGARADFKAYLVDPAQPSRSLDAPIQGVPYRAQLNLDYTLSAAGNGSFEVTLAQRRRNSDAVMNALGMQTKSVPPGTNAQTSIPIDVTFPIPAVPTKGDFYLRITLKDDQGKILITKEQDGSVTSPGQVNFGNRQDEDDEDEPTPAVFPGVLQAGSVVRTGQTYFRPGDDVSANLALSWLVRTPAVTNWQIDLDRVESLGGAGNRIETYSTGAKVEPIPTTPDWNAATLDVIAAGKTVPSTAAKLRFHARLLSAGKLMARDSIDVEVRAPAQTQTVNVPPGSLNASFSQVQTEIDFTSNTQGGTLTAERFEDTFGSSGPGKTSDYTAWQLIPLNRYWAIFGDLQEGTYQGTVTFTYDPALDFPGVSGFVEDSLVVTGLNPLSGELEALPSTLDAAANSISAEFTTFFQTYVVASKRTVQVQTADESESELPAEYALEQNYPNPFNPTTTFTFRMPVSGEATLKVFNLLGQEVATLAEGPFAAGVHRVDWNAGSAASSVYLVRLQAGGFVQVRKAVLLR